MLLGAGRRHHPAESLFWSEGVLFLRSQPSVLLWHVNLNAGSLGARLAEIYRAQKICDMKLVCVRSPLSQVIVQRDLK